MAQSIAPVVCVQNFYNLAHRADDPLVDALAATGIAYVPFFPLGGFSRLQSAALSGVADRRGATPMAVALAWLLSKGGDIAPIPGTKRVDRLEENVAADAVELTAEQLRRLDALPPAEGGHHSEEQMALIQR